MLPFSQEAGLVLMGAVAAGLGSVVTAVLGHFLGRKRDRDQWERERQGAALGWGVDEARASDEALTRLDVLLRTFGVTIADDAHWDPHATSSPWHFLNWPGLTSTAATSSCTPVSRFVRDSNADTHEQLMTDVDAARVAAEADLRAAIEWRDVRTPGSP